MLSDNQQIVVGTWEGELALRFAKARCHGQVYMDGKHNPLPSEIQAARMFIEDLLSVGWTPPESGDDKP